MKVYRNVAGHRVHQFEEGVPEPEPGEVRVRIRAVSLNYRDLLVLTDPSAAGRVPLSDGSGEIDAVGEGVATWAIGDRVVLPFFRDWREGPFRSSYMTSALGGRTTDGVLADYVVMPAAAAVALPANLSFEQGATLPCAAVTVWAGLIERAGLSSDDTVLIQGTGGVALFALQIAQSYGAHIIIISSSDEKLARAKALGATVGINYSCRTDWDAAVREATDGKGATRVLELGGRDTYERSLSSLAAGGKLIQIGVLTGFGSKPNLTPLQSLNADIIGVTVGSRAHLKEVSDFLASRMIAPVIDKVYNFDNINQALERLRSGDHFGKIVLSRK